MAGSVYLADTTVFVLQERHPAIQRRFLGLLTEGRLAACQMSALEYLNNAPDPRGYEIIWDSLHGMRWIDVTTDALNRALAVHHRLGGKKPAPQLPPTRPRDRRHRRAERCHSAALRHRLRPHRRNYRPEHRVDRASGHAVETRRRSTLKQCLGLSRSSPWGARATRSTPKSWPAASSTVAGSSPTTRLPRTRSWSIPAASSRRRRRTPSTPCSMSPTATQTVVAVGCLAERYGDQLAAALPEADAVLGFDSYADIAQTLRSIADGDVPVAAPAPGSARAASDHPGPASALHDADARTWRPPGRRRAGVGSTYAATPSPRRADRAAEDCFRLRPAVLVLRDPVLSRRLPIPSTR